MWQAVYNEHGVHLPDGWWPFSQAIMSDHTPYVKIEFLNAGNLAVEDWIDSGGGKGEITNVVSDGNIDIDFTRGTRRTAELTILNPTSQFTPATSNFDPAGAYVGLVFINRLVRIWRGVNIDGNKLVVPVGTFMIDTAEVIAEKNMSIVNLTMSDQWKRLTKSIMGFNKKYEKGTYYNAIIRDLLAPIGLPPEGSQWGPWLDPLHNRDWKDRMIGKPIKLTRGMNRGTVLKELAESWDLDVFFNPVGRFKSYDRYKMSQKQTVWWYNSRPIDVYGRHGGLISLTRSFNDDNLYNHVIVIGTGDKKHLWRHSIKNDTGNNTSRQVLGDRVYLKETDKLSTERQVIKAAQRIWARRFQLSESIRAEVVCNPALDADDVVRIREDKFIKVDGRYRLQRLNVPLVTSRQEIEANVVLGRDDL